jgi:hypothetical protein
MWVVLPSRCFPFCRLLSKLLRVFEGFVNGVEGTFRIVIYCDKVCKGKVLTNHKREKYSNLCTSTIFRCDSAAILTGCIRITSQFLKHQIALNGGLIYIFNGG